ncbi:heavy-metal-associated domain-containing protein [Occultella aeris]|uniref:Zinc/cadmium/mercury/lead-transporting ATPase n=2 Tax=Occultella aeris TaxID=2761496 RepID=A0A7M4DKR5_9MICO|nr:heavy metal-associated domain-containing protein [Occultella aeris]VZO37756.1 zinc/cadmium/mercury/lead-transporting ATPase [Occultella aeris]
MSTTTTYAVTGLTCSCCAKSVTTELNKIDGVHDVQVDVVPDSASRVTLTSSSDIAADDVRGAIEAAGYALSDPATA